MRLRFPRPSKRGCLILLLLATFFLVLRPTPIFGPVKMFFVSIFAPIQAQLFKAGSKLSRLVGDVAHKRDLAEQNRQLRERIEKLEAALSAEIDRRYSMQEELDSLKVFLSEHEDEEVKGVVAHVVGWDSTGWRSSILIDKGAPHGVGKNQPVVWHDYVVGVVEEVETWSTTSRVKLLTDPQCRVMARAVRSQAKCIVEGTADGQCHLKYVFDSADIKKGDIITTTGEHGIFPRHVLIGTVTSVETSEVGLFKKVIVQPRMSPRSLESVFVIERLSARAGRPTGKKRK
ncbi:MAG: rod shape-determining protein MreC [Planctomycetota bacterium]